MRESRLVSLILAYLNGLPAGKAIKIHGSQFMEAGTPDVLAVVNGRAVLVEVKTGTKTSPIQEYRIGQWRDAGAVVVVARSLDDVMAAVRSLPPHPHPTSQTATAGTRRPSWGSGSL